MRIGRRYTLQASHLLDGVPPGHKCGRLHGHTYTLEVEIVGAPQEPIGWVLDYAMIDVVVKQLVLDVLDHRHLNEILTPTTSEALVDWIWTRLAMYGWPPHVRLERVRIAENDYSWAERFDGPARATIG